MTNGTPLSWTISIIAQFDDDVKDEYLELEESIMLQEPNPLVRYLIFSYDQRSQMACIKEAMVTPSGNYLIHIVENLGYTDLYDGEKLIYFLKNYVWKRTKPAELNKHLMITWGHGLGLGFFFRETNKKRKALQVRHPILSGMQGEIRKIKFVKSQMSVQDEHLDFKKLFEDFQITQLKRKKKTVLKFEDWKTIFLQEIKLIPAEKFASILSKGLPGQKIEVLIAMNCFMQTLETGYALKDAVNTLIAPQSTISFRGYNYQALFSMLHQSRYVDSVSIAKNVINSIQLKYLEDSPGRPDDVDIEEIAISANALSFYQDVKTVINSISEYLIGNYRNAILSDGLPLKTKVITARQHCNYLTAGLNMGIIDFKHFIDELIKKLDYRDVKGRLLMEFRKLAVLQKKIVIAQRVPSKFFWHFYSLPTLVSGSAQMFSIFFPINLGDEKYLKYFLKNFYSRKAIGQPKLNKDFLWDDFVLLVCKDRNILP